jgi:predicted ester cyclase
MGNALETVERWWALFEEGDLEAMAQLTTADADIMMPGGMRLTGPEGLRPLLDAYRVAFPTLHHNVVSVIEQPNAVALELRVEVEHTGPFVTPMGTIPPSGNRFVIESCDIVRLDDSGRIALWHAYGDMASMMANMGAGTAA